MTTAAYSQCVAPYYDLFEGDIGRADEQLAWVQRRVKAGASVLDVGAGTGALAMTLASAGYSVTALEPDPEMYGQLLARLGARRDLEHMLMAPLDAERRCWSSTAWPSSSVTPMTAARRSCPERAARCC